MSVIDLIDGRIAELDRLAEEAERVCERDADGDRLRLVLAALRALRLSKFGKDGEEG